MPAISAAEDTRQLVTVGVVSDVRPIPDADAIEVITVRGWHVVTRIGEFHPGDKCLYFEIDSMLPMSDSRFTFLAERGTREVDGRTYHRLKTARLRGVYSQGLVMPLSDFAEIDETGNIAECLGVIKYELPLSLQGGSIAGPFPVDLGRKTDSERIQNLVDAWDAIKSFGPWIATEKIDGTSCSVFSDAEGILHVCGRNYEISEGDNLYWNAVRANQVDKMLHPGEGVQFEIYGNGVQRNPLAVSGVRIAVFGFTRDQMYVPRDQWPTELLAHAVPVYTGLDLPDSVEESIEQVERLDSLINPDKQAEGIVWHQVDAKVIPELDHRNTFKVLSNRYLLKHEQ